VHHSPVNDILDVLVGANQSIDRIIGDVETALRGVPASVQASGVPLWGDLQATWNARYEDMRTRALLNVKATDGAYEEYKWGDQQSTYIMSS